MPFTIRSLVLADLPDLARLERLSYKPEMRETEAAWLSKMAVFGAGALGCFASAEMCGYAFALPWTRERVIEVGQVVEALPVSPDVMYIHDMVVAPAWRRRGVAARLLARIVELAEETGLSRLSLVAVQDAEPFWQRMGFASVERFDYVAGIAATKMERRLPPRPR